MCSAVLRGGGPPPSVSESLGWAGREPCAAGPRVPRVLGRGLCVLAGPFLPNHLSSLETLYAFFQVSVRIKATQRTFA